MLAFSQFCREQGGAVDDQKDGMAGPGVRKFAEHLDAGIPFLGHGAMPVYFRLTINRYFPVERKLFLDRIKVALTQAQQAQVRFEDGAVDYARAHRKNRIELGIDIYELEILADKCQTGVGTEVVGQFFDNEFGHVRAHLQGEALFFT